MPESQQPEQQSGGAAYERALQVMMNGEPGARDAAAEVRTTC